MQPGEVEVHYVVYDQFDDDVAFARLGPDLDAEEHARLARMRRPEPWRHFLVAHALRRRVGGEISSLTHTNGAVAVAVATQGQVGVDVEELTRQIDPRDGFERFFTAEEWRWIHESDTTERFLRLWTLKEAWSKAIGLGLSANFTEAPIPESLWGGPPGLRGTSTSRSAEGRPGGRPQTWRSAPQEDWCFEQWIIEGRFVIAAASSSPATFRLINSDLADSLQ